MLLLSLPYALERTKLSKAPAAHRVPHLIYLLRPQRHPPGPHALRVHGAHRRLRGNARSRRRHPVARAAHHGNDAAAGVNDPASGGACQDAPERDGGGE